MACSLGLCRADDYRITIVDRPTGTTLLEVQPETVEWSRELDGISRASVRLPSNCCGALADVRTWRHELHISRAGEQTWEGPISVDASCRSGNVLEARDILWWQTRRVIHNDHIWAAIGAVPAARELLIDGYQPDDPNAIQYIQDIGTGVVQGRTYLTNSDYVMTAIDDLAKGNLDYTTIGRRIVLMPQGYQLGRLSLLTCDHFQGDVCGTEDGYAAATRAVVKGKDDSGIVGSFGGTDSYFGLIEVLTQDDAITSSTTAADQARGIVNGANPPPFLVQPPDGSALSPDAPLCMAELVPGVTIPVSLDCTCRTTTQDMRLTKLQVTVDASGEQVQPFLTPIGFDNGT
jgi:hypothetical protein